jgi:hypothetical protein
MVKEKTNEKDLSYLKNFLNQPSKQNEHLADEPSFISDIRGSNCSNFTKQYQIDEMKQSNASSHILKDINPMPSNGSSQQSLQQLKLMDQLRHSKELMNLRRKSRGAEIGGGLTKHY